GAYPKSSTISTAVIRDQSKASASFSLAAVVTFVMLSSVTDASLQQKVLLTQ
ncbi:Uncharacterized protein DAT39_012047, partial [Clarias magur]